MKRSIRHRVRAVIGASLWAVLVVGMNVPSATSAPAPVAVTEPSLEARRIGRAAAGVVKMETGVYRDPVKWAHLMVESNLELYRATGEDYLLQRARKNADTCYETWQTNRPADLISNASIARVFWLFADLESDVGRAFWQASDKPVR